MPRSPDLAMCVLTQTDRQTEQIALPLAYVCGVKILIVLHYSYVYKAYPLVS